MNSSYDKNFGAQADNKPEEDARHFYMSSSLHCVRPHSRRFATFMSGDRNDFFRQDVSRHLCAANR